MPNCRRLGMSDVWPSQNIRINVRNLCQLFSAGVSACSGGNMEGETYRHIIAVHEREMFGARIEPALRTEGVWVRTENCRVAMGYPGVYADDRLNHIDTTHQLPNSAQRTSKALVLLTPGGKNFPEIVTPCSGTTRHSGRPVAGNILWPSLITACRYGIR